MLSGVAITPLTLKHAEELLIMAVDTKKNIPKN